MRALLINLFVVLFLLGWVTQEFALFNAGHYSILLLYIAAIPFFRLISGRSFTFVVLPFISTLLAALVSVFKGGIKPMGVVSQAGLQLLAIFFAAGVAAIDWRKHLVPFTKAIVVISAPIVAFAGYQLFARPKHMRYAFLPVTNQQAHAVGDLQRGWEKDHFTRASSIFVEPSELGYFCLWLLILGLTASKGPWRVCALALAFSGMLFSQSLSGVLGAAVLILAYVCINPINFNVIRQVGIVVLLSLMTVVVVIPLMPEAFNAFSKRIEQAVTLDNRADSGRVDHLPANWEAFKDAPIWGQGLASISSAEENGTDVTTFTYFLVLIERGLVGGLMFLAPWLWLAWRSLRIPSPPLRTLCVLLSALNLYTFATSSIAYFLPYWFALGVCASCVLESYRPSYRLKLTGWEPLQELVDAGNLQQQPVEQ